MEPKYHPFEILDLCPYCWKHPCSCVHSPVSNPISIRPKVCEHCLEKDQEILKLKNLLALAGVGY